MLKRVDTSLSNWSRLFCTYSLFLPYFEIHHIRTIIPYRVSSVMLRTIPISITPSYDQQTVIMNRVPNRGNYAWKPNHQIFIDFEYCFARGHSLLWILTFWFAYFRAKADSNRRKYELQNKLVYIYNLHIRLTIN